MKRQLLVIPLLILLIPVLPANAVLQPVIEELDLFVDGSINPVHINQTGDYTFITRILFSLHWRSNVINHDDFGLVVAGLVNGTSISYDGQLLTGPMTNIHDFAHVAFDSEIVTDDKNPKDNHLTSRLSFFKFVPEGLRMGDNRNLTFTIEDDMTAAGDLFVVIIEGYKTADTGNPPVNAVWSPVNILNFWVTSVMPVAAMGIFTLVAAIAIWKVATAWRQ